MALMLWLQQASADNLYLVSETYIKIFIGSTILISLI